MSWTDDGLPPEVSRLRGGRPAEVVIASDVVVQVTTCGPRMLLGRSRVRPATPLGGTAVGSATDVPARSRHSVTIISLISRR